MKKTADRLFSCVCAFLICGLIVPCIFTACKSTGVNETGPASTTTIDSTFPDRLHNSKDLAFTASCENGGPFEWGCDYWTRTSYYVYYNGVIEIKTSYTLSGESAVTKEISYTDLRRIRSLADTFRENRSHYNLDFSNCYDMDSWSFYTYDLSGNRTSVYSGFTVGISELVGIQNTLSGYQVKESPADRAYNLFEGKYVCPDDDQQYVSLYKKDGQIYLEVKPAGRENAEVYEIKDIDLYEKSVFFGYVQDGIWQYFSYNYSVGKTMLQDTETSVNYNKQMEKTEGESLRAETEA